MSDDLTGISKSDFADSADTDVPPAQCLPPSMEAPHEPCEMLGDEAEPPKQHDVLAPATLCPRCAVLSQATQIKSVTEFSRWLRACGFSRAAATRLAGHGWPKSDTDVAGRSELAEGLRALAEMLQPKE